MRHRLCNAADQVSYQIRAQVTISGLKAQANKFPPREKNRVTAKDFVLERLE